MGHHNTDSELHHNFKFGCATYTQILQILMLAWNMCTLYIFKGKTCIILGMQMCDFNTTQTQGAFIGYVISPIFK
jgi:hypothetical protein